MSMPQHFVVAVICGKGSTRGEKASAVAAILTGPNKKREIAPDIFPVAFGRCRPRLFQYAKSKGYIIRHNPLHSLLVKSKEIDLWLALDEDGVQKAQKRIRQQGISSTAVYREIFPEPVLYCGFPVPEPPSEPIFEEWFSSLVEKFTPWKERIWKAFYDSS